MSPSISLVGVKNLPPEVLKENLIFAVTKIGKFLGIPKVCVKISGQIKVDKEGEYTYGDFTYNSNKIVIYVGTILYLAAAENQNMLINLSKTLVHEMVHLQQNCRKAEFVESSWKEKEAVALEKILYKDVLKYLKLGAESE